MKVSHSAVHDAPLDDVHSMLTDPAFREHACVQQGTRAGEAWLEGDRP